MLRPFLLIGVGGSGGKTLRVIRRDLQWRLEQAGWPAQEGFPKAWQFLQIDVASAPDGDDPDLPPQLPPADFLGLVNAGLTYSSMDSTLADPLTSSDRLNSLGGWRPDPNKVQVAITRGAGQYRALGRVVALTRLAEIKKRVDRAVDALTDVDVARQLGRLTSLIGASEPRPETSPPVTVVISSIAGGSGAGAVVEVCDVVRAAGRPWLDESVGILYAPDVFDDIPEAARRGVRPNALATLSEIISGCWSFDGRDGGITAASARLYQGMGVETTSINRLGPRYPVLVGARNADVSYGTQNEIYRGMGRAIAEWVTNVELQDAMGAYFSGNRQSTAVAIPDRLGLKQQHHETPFSGLGFARMSLGRDYFARYAGQYLARKAAELITTRHLEGRRVDDRRTDEEIVAALAEQAWPSFLAASGLDERGLEANQVIVEIRPTDTTQYARQWIETGLIGIKSGGSIPADGLAMEVWQSRIERRLREEGPTLRDQLRAARLARARAWVDEIQTSLPKHAMHALATHGGPVTIELLKRLDQELGHIVRELPTEQSDQQQRAERARADIRAALSPEARGKLAADNTNLETAMGRAAASIGYQAEADLRALVESILRDLRRGLLEPLTRAVEHAVEGLRSDTRRESGKPSKVEFWPTGDAVPAPLRPARNEFLLDDISEFSQTMRALLMRDTGQHAPLDAELATVRDVIVDGDGASLDKPHGDAAVRRRTWVPAVQDLQGGLQAPNTAILELVIGCDDLLVRADRWVRSDQRSFGRHLQQSLERHLNEEDVSPAELKRRRQRFAGQLKSTIGRAQPLVNIDREVLALVHDKQEVATTLIMSPIPVSSSSEAAKLARDVLATSRSTLEDLNNPFTDAEGQEVSIFGVLTEPYEPVVFSSLMKPLVDEWAEVRQSDDARQSFWTWRRARPLAEFVPAAPAVRRAMLRGWFTALLLGQLRGHVTPGGAVSIWAPSPTGGNGGWMNFPHPLLRTSANTAETIGALLESLPLALMATYAERKLQPLRPYHRLRDLGAAGSQQGFENYEALGAELADWLSQGRVTVGAPDPDERVGTPRDDIETRRARLLSRLEELRNAYRKRNADLMQRAPVSVPRDFELHSDIQEALDDLTRGIESAASGEDVVFT